jgi:outer membrane protein OmpA-like peptidoglycan-associated protein
MRFPSIVTGLLFLLCSSPPAFADGDDVQDCEGCRDHPMLARYPGSALVGADQVAFEEAALPTGPAARNPDTDETIPLKTLNVTGKRTRLFYLPPTSRSALEVFTNYREALEKAGMTTLWTCSGDQECGRNFADQAVAITHLDDLSNTTSARIGFSDAERPRYLVAELKRPAGDLHVVVIAADFSTRQGSGAYVLVVEGKPMDKGLVTLDAGALDRDLLSTGKAVIYGIHFDFDKADIKPESKPQLDEIARLLSTQPKLKLRITGHTDNRGGADYNVQLSQRRAQAIVAALVGTYGISGDRLSAAGMGANAPVASNDNEDGRARNRRVELVKQ